VWVEGCLEVLGERVLGGDAVSLRGRGERVFVLERALDWVSAGFVGDVSRRCAVPGGHLRSG
jgi:hypothetical protein